MIADSLKNIGLYKGLSKNLDTAIDYLNKTDLLALADGKHIIDGDKVYIMVQSPEFKPENGWEAHRRYIDIQIALKDGETIEWLALDRVSGWSEYDEQGDYVASKDPVKGIALQPLRGDFSLFFPQDAHKPGLGNGQGHKAVVKVRVE